MLVTAGCVYAAPAGAVSFQGPVSSGDVTSSRAVLLTHADTAETYKVEGWTNPSLTGPKAFKGKVKTDAAKGFTIKIDVTGLTPNTQYWFRFSKDAGDTGGAESDVATFKTAPAANQSADFEIGYTGDADGTLKPDNTPAFNNFEVLAALDADNPDTWVFHGDTIYADSSFRQTGPATTLAEYRAAHALNQSYPALDNLMASTSTIGTMDDHEVVNDFAGQTVDPARYAAGRQAFLEAYPVRETGLPHDPSCAGDPLYRKFQWGSEVELFVLDLRSCRSGSVAANPCLGDLGPTLPPAIRQSSPFNLFLAPNPPAGCVAAINNPSRTLMGPAQKAQFKQDLANSTATHKFVLGQEPIQQFHVLPYDRYEGYAAERTEILQFIQNNGIDNVSFLSTDTHATLQNEVFVDRFTAPATIGQEMVTGPVATNTFRSEVISVGGLLGFAAVNAIMTVDGLNCRNMDKNSYATAVANATTGKVTLTSKDDTGATVMNAAGQPPGDVPCTITTP
jgi:phosphodiesterase/alkaline phosphatase D-like protein